MKYQTGFAFYWRTSTQDKQKPENSREYQLEASLRRIEKLGYIAAEYGDTQSGSDWNRGEFQRLLDDAKDPNRNFDTVIVYDYDRLSRVYSDQEDAIRFLQSHGSRYTLPSARLMPTTSQEGSQGV